MHIINAERIIMISLVRVYLLNAYAPISMVFLNSHEIKVANRLFNSWEQSFEIIIIYNRTLIFQEGNSIIE